MTVETTTLELQRATEQVPQLVQQAQALEVNDADGVRRAMDLAGALASMKKFVGGIFSPIKRRIDQSKREALDQEKALLDPVTRADEIVRGKVRDYETARQRKEDEDRQKREADARKQAQDEQLNRAVSLENLSKATGDPLYAQQAERVLDTPVRAVVVPAAPPPKLEGGSFRATVEVMIVDPRALLAAVGSGAVVVSDETAAKVADALMPWLRTEARQRGEAFDIPGVVRRDGIGLSVRAR